MKKMMITLFLTFITVSINYAQDKFRADYSLISFFDPENGDWSEWQYAEHTLVFNYNSNNDIVHYTPKGEIFTYRNMGNKEEGYTDGNHYQIIDVIDDEGNYLQIQLFDDPAIGMKIMYGNFMIQLSNE